MQRRHFMAATVAATSPLVWAQDKYPSKPIVWVCPYAAGGNADSRSRQIAMPGAPGTIRPRSDSS